MYVSMTASHCPDPGRTHKDKMNKLCNMFGEDWEPWFNLFCSARHCACDGRRPNEFVILDLAVDLQLCLLYCNSQSLFVQVPVVFLFPARSSSAIRDKLLLLWTQLNYNRFRLWRTQAKRWWSGWRGTESLCAKELRLHQMNNLNVQRKDWSAYSKP